MKAEDGVASALQSEGRLVGNVNEGTDVGADIVAIKIKFRGSVVCIARVG